jgi:hypothetical protein
VKRRKNFFEIDFEKDVSYGYIHEDFQEETMLYFTPIDQNQDYVVENCVNIFQDFIFMNIRKRSELYIIMKQYESEHISKGTYIKWHIQKVLLVH